MNQEVDKMRDLSRIHCDAYDKEINKSECEHCCIKRRFNVLKIEKCPYYGEVLVQIVKLQAEDLNRLRNYADKNGGNPVSHYIREAVAEYISNHHI